MSPLEHASREEIDAYQNAALGPLLAYLQTNSPFYQRQFAALDFEVADIRTVADLARLPTTSKQDLQEHNWDFLCVPRREVAEYCSTSGTLGRPVTIALTAADLARLHYNEYLSFACADGSPADLYQLMLTLDRQFMAGVAYYGGILKSEASVIRMGPGNLAAQLDTIRELAPTVLVAVPSFVVALVAHARTTGFDLNTSSVRRIICIGESRASRCCPGSSASSPSPRWAWRACPCCATAPATSAPTTTHPAPAGAPPGGLVPLWAVSSNCLSTRVPRCTRKPFSTS